MVFDKIKNWFFKENCDFCESETATRWYKEWHLCKNCFRGAKQKVKDRQVEGKND